MMDDDLDLAGSRPTRSRRRAFLTFVGLPLLFFLLGLAFMGWLLVRWDRGAELIGVVPAAEAPQQAAQPVETAPQANGPETAAAPPTSPPETIVIDPEITRRVAALEQQVSRIENQSRAAVGNADRAEGLLVAFAARRALDRGVALGFLEALLRQRFGESQPRAVGIIIASAREPVTLQELQEGLQQVSDQLVGAGPDQSWWDALKSELGSLITVRREGTPSTQPRTRLDRAKRRLEAGQVDVALAEVLRLPGREHARDWINMARRYINARMALDTIETAALLEPRAPQLPPDPAVAPEGAEPPPQPAPAGQ